MKKYTLILPPLIVLLMLAEVSQAIDYKLFTIADGEASRTSSDGTTRIMWADNSSSGSYARRAVLMFDTSQVSQYQLRGAELNMWGGRSSSDGVPTLSIRHYYYDAWSDSSVPYASTSGSLLAQTQIPEVLNSYYPNRNKYAISIGGNMPYDGDNRLSLVMTASGGSAAFYTRNTVSWDGSKGLEPYLAYRTWGATTTLNSTFNNDSLADTAWDVVSGGGSAQIVNHRNDRSAELTTGSPVKIQQSLDTPEDPFYILFDYEFLTTTGALEITLTNRDGVEFVAGELDAPGELAGKMNGAALHVTDPGWLYLDNVSLGFELDGITGSQIILDNVEFSNVPEPAAIAIFGLGALILKRRKR
ncbi:hypothetical protein SMSP2_00261 [Limihaloglobus sulfuriphilus]|uniref:Ice-binding protein C-terminal domain-containing protein n=1 Tax=Limihaloglobus sulfuriphilus TaxID=1851148 RepID=A0A1Q2MCD0_9BACT|nr:PEP-CTERM sorting domain-containing protein [Limihaloglobus sulfuriphilus]AQQ69927.1 hypothetical protein SMSP2_00261 [Limihaloglobus sulfuriphilus]